MIGAMINYEVVFIAGFAVETESSASFCIDSGIKLDDFLACGCIITFLVTPEVALLSIYYTPFATGSVKV